jgi:hypothetical protein
MQADEGEERKTFVSTLTRRLPTPFGNAPSYLFVVMRVTFSIILPNVCENRDIWDIGCGRSRTKGRDSVLDASVN